MRDMGFWNNFWHSDTGIFFPGEGKQLWSAVRKWPKKEEIFPSSQSWDTNLNIIR